MSIIQIQLLYFLFREILHVLEILLFWNGYCSSQVEFNPFICNFRQPHAPFLKVPVAGNMSRRSATMTSDPSHT